MESTAGQLISINVAQIRTVSFMGKAVRTGIYKAPVSGPVMVRQLSVDGDAQADLKVHGGIDKAVYVYAAENYDLWRAELERELPYGHFGENMTVTGLLEGEVHGGDVLEVGGAVLQVTTPRLPCFKLGIKMSNQRFLRRFLESGRSGFYCRVLQEGQIEASQEIRLLSREEDQPAIADIVRRARE